MKKIISMLLILLISFASVSALAEGAPHSAAYDPEAFTQAFLEVKALVPEYAGYDLVPMDFSEKENADLILAAYVLANASAPQEEEYAEITIFYDDSDTAAMFGIAPESLDLDITCSDDGKNGEWKTYIALFGDLVSYITKDTKVSRWLQDQGKMFLLDYTINFSSTIDTTYEGDGFEVLFAAVGEGFSLLISVWPAQG